MGPARRIQKDTPLGHPKHRLEKINPNATPHQTRPDQDQAKKGGAEKRPILLLVLFGPFSPLGLIFIVSFLSAALTLL